VGIAVWRINRLLNGGAIGISLARTRDKSGETTSLRSVASTVAGSIGVKLGMSNR
jgi:hypothetical protein